MKTLFLIFSIFLIVPSKGQSNCPSRTIYRTDNVGEEKDSVLFKLSLHFEVMKDSIITSLGNKGNPTLYEFGIISHECHWNDTQTVGKSVFKVLMNDTKANREATLTIDFSDTKKRFIEVMWENGRTRYFSIAKEYDTP